MVFLTVVVPVNTLLLLILSGDVETNPGPLTVSQLDQALKKLVDWDRFAIYLPLIDFSDVQKIDRMSISDDRKKLQLYGLWLSKYSLADFNDVVNALKMMEEYSLADAVEQGFIEPPTKIPRYSLENTSLATKNYPLTPIDAHSYLPRRKTPNFDIEPPSKIASLEMSSSQTHQLAPDDVNSFLPTQTQKMPNLPFPHPCHSMQHQTVTTWSPQYHNPAAQYQPSATSSSGGSVPSSARNLVQTPEKCQITDESSIQPTHTDQCNVAATVVLSGNSEMPTMSNTEPHVMDNVIRPYVDYLQGYYQRSKLPTYFKYPSPSISEFINLLVVHKKQKESNKEKQAVMKYKVRGNVANIKAKRESILMRKIGKGDSQPRFVLIEGDPGVGKTTLVWELCKGWAEGRLLQEWNIVLLVQLRDIDMREADSIESMVDPDGDYPELCDYIKHNLGDRLLLIFDGFDELSDKQREKTSVFIRLLRGKKLSKASIFVTSRPSATSLLPEQFYDKLHQHIEVVGFEDKDIRKYIDSKFKTSDDPSIFDDFNAYISSHHFIFTLMYVPLHCALVTDLYEQYWRKGEKQFAPKTLTQLYTCFISCLLERYLEDVPQHRGLKIHDVTDLPHDVYLQLIQLAELAARGIENKEYVFDNVECETLGLLQKVSEDNRRSRNTTVSYSFLHLTLQEYLAALHWSKCREEVSRLFEPDGALPVKHYFKKKITVSNIHWPSLHFYAGLTGVLGTPLEGIIKAYQSTEYNYLYLLFECQHAELVSSVFKEGGVESTIRSHMEAYVTGYCIARSCESVKWKITMKKSGFVVNLANGMKYAVVPGKGGRIIRLDVSGSSDCDVFSFLNLLGELNDFIHQLHLHYKTNLKTFKLSELNACFSLDRLEYDGSHGKEINTFLIGLLDNLTKFESLNNLSISSTRDPIVFSDNLVASVEQFKRMTGSIITLRCFDLHCIPFKLLDVSNFPFLSVPIVSKVICYRDKKPYVYEHSLLTFLEWYHSLSDKSNDTLLRFFSEEYCYLQDKSPATASGMQENSSELSGIQKNELNVVLIMHQWLLASTVHTNVYCCEQSSNCVLSVCEDRILVSPDNVEFLTRKFKSGVKLQSLTVLPGDSEDELIQTVIQSARDNNPGLIMRNIKLELDLSVNEDVQTFFNTSYQMSDTSDTDVEKHIVEVRESYISTVLQQCVSLTSVLISLSIDGRYSSIDGILSITRLLSDSISLKQLTLRNIDFNSDEATSISSGSCNKQGLEIVSFINVQGDHGALLKGLSHYKTLKELTLRSYQIDEGKEALYTLLSQSELLTKLVLEEINLNSDEATSISNGFSNNQGLEILSFNNVQGDHGVLLKGLSHHKTLKELMISGKFKVDEGTKSLLSQSMSLRKLALENINLDSNEAALISEGLSNNQGLEAVCFDRVIGDHGTLLKGLIHHKTLLQLIIKFQLTVEHLLNVIDTAEMLSHVVIYGCGLTSTQLQAIVSGAANKNLKEIAVYEYRLQDITEHLKLIIEDVVQNSNTKVILSAGSIFLSSLKEQFSQLSLPADRVVFMDYTEYLFTLFYFL